MTAALHVCLAAWTLAAQDPLVHTEPPPPPAVAAPSTSPTGPAADVTPPPPPDDAPAPPAAPGVLGPGPAPDLLDAKDAVVRSVAAPSPDGAVFALERDAAGLTLHAVLAAIPAAFALAIPGALVSLGIGGVGALMLIAAPILAPVPLVAPMLALACLLPALLPIAAGSAVGAFAAQVFSNRRGPLLMSVGGTLLGALVASAVLAIPVLVMTAVLGAATFLVPGSPMLATSGELTNQQSSMRTGLLLALALHPLVAATWFVVGGTVAGLGAGAVSAAVYRARGRTKAPGEGWHVDMSNVDAAPEPQDSREETVPSVKRRKRAPRD